MCPSVRTHTHIHTLYIMTLPWHRDLLHMCMCVEQSENLPFPYYLPLPLYDRLYHFTIRLYTALLQGDHKMVVHITF